MLRARRAASVTSPNLEATRSRRSSIGGVIIVSCSRSISSPALGISREMLPGDQAVSRGVLARRLDDVKHLDDRVLEVVVDDDVVGERPPDGLLVLGLAQAGEDLVGGIPALAEASLLLLA